MPRFGRIVAAARQHGGHGRVQRLARRQAAAQPRADLREIRFAGADQVGTLLQVTRILGRLAVHQARMRGSRRNNPAAPVAATSRINCLHRLGELMKADGVLDQFPRVRWRQRLVIGEEIVRLREIVFRLLVVAAMDGVVRPLEQALLAVLRRT